MILELDCGNSFIKWRVLAANGERIGSGIADSVVQLLDAIADPHFSLRHCRLVSVRSADETSALVAALSTGFSLACYQAVPAREQGGVRNGYADYRQLGLDRWLGVLAAYRLSQGRGCLILDFGTAAVSDFVRADGEHLGGFICPGMTLMRNELRTHTRRIRYDEEDQRLATSSLLPGRNTAEAVERGCQLMLRDFAKGQRALATQLLDDDFDIYLTGGDACLVEDDIPQGRVVADLVFDGLAVACPLPKEH